MSQFEQGPFAPFLPTRPDEVDPGLLSAFKYYTERHDVYRADVSEVMANIEELALPAIKITVADLPRKTVYDDFGVERIMGFDFTTGPGVRAFIRYAEWLPKTTVFNPGIIGTVIPISLQAFT